MLQQIIKIIWKGRTSNVWIWGEMLLVSICLWYIVDDLYLQGKLYTSPLGYDIENTYLVELKLLSAENAQFRPQEEYGSTIGEDLLMLESRMRTFPGVEAVGISYASVPYSYRRSYSNLSRINQETNDTLEIGSARRYQANPDFVRVFRFTTPEGDTEILAKNLTRNQLIISKDVEKVIYPEGNATGKLINQYVDDSLEIRIGGVMAPIRFGEFDTYTPTFIQVMTDKMIADELTGIRFGGTEITIRVNPSANKDFADRFKKDMKTQLRYHNMYLLDIRPFKDIRSRFIRSDINDAKMYLSAVFFLLVNIFLGVVGTFWFRTEHRKGEMGLRIALGSTKNNLRFLFIGEGLALLFLAFIPSMIICLNIGVKEIVNITIMPFTIGRFLLCQFITLILMSMMIITGVWFPARKTIKLKPAEALRYE